MNLSEELLPGEVLNHVGIFFINKSFCNPIFKLGNNVWQKVLPSSKDFSFDPIANATFKLEKDLEPFI